MFPLITSLAIKLFLIHNLLFSSGCNMQICEPVAASRSSRLAPFTYITRDIVANLQVF